VTWRQAADGWSRVPSSTAPAETGRLVSDGVTRPVFVSDGRTGGQPDLWVWDGAGWSPHPGGRGVQGR